MLLDAVIALSIFVVAMLAYTGTICTSAMTCARANQRTKATQIIERQLEAIKSLGYGNASYTGLLFYNMIDSSPNASPYSFTSIGSTADKITSILPGGTGQLTIVDTNAYTRTITATVSWPSRQGQRTMSMSTQLAQLK